MYEGVTIDNFLELVNNKADDQEKQVFVLDRETQYEIRTNPAYYSMSFVRIPKNPDAEFEITDLGENRITVDEALWILGL